MIIKKITINENAILVSNMVLIVGANGTGKTRLLDEIHSAFAGRNRNTNHWNLNLEHESTEKDQKIWYSNLHQFIERKNII